MSKATKVGLTAISVVLLSACTTIQTRHMAEARVVKGDFAQAYQAATGAALSAGFTIVSTDKDAGLINATRGANALLVYQNPAINISVQKRQDGVMIVVASTVGGQMMDYGVTEDTIVDYCKALAVSIEIEPCVFK